MSLSVPCANRRARSDLDPPPLALSFHFFTHNHDGTQECQHYRVTRSITQSGVLRRRFGSGNEVLLDDVDWKRSEATVRPGDCAHWTIGARNLMP